MIENLSYKTIENRINASFIEKKSEFIGYLCPVQSEEDAISFINEIKAMHRRARHNCYCYILRDNNTVRYSDDGEPQGTAGIPIYEAIRKANLTDICCVVTRYFGGILLGGGGLVRAYTKATSLAIQSAEIMEMAMAFLVKVKVNYSLYGKLGAIFSELDARILTENFTDEVEITLYIKSELYNELESKLIEASFGQVFIENLQKEYYNFA